MSICKKKYSRLVKNIVEIITKIKLNFINSNSYNVHAFHLSY